MNEKTKSLIRHILVALGTVLAFIGLNDYVPIVDYLMENLDGVWQAIATIVGVISTIFGFFKDKDRFEAREKAKA